MTTPRRFAGWGREGGQHVGSTCLEAYAGGCSHNSSGYGSEAICCCCYGEHRQGLLHQLCSQGAVLNEHIAYVAVVLVCHVAFGYAHCILLRKLQAFLVLLGVRIQLGHLAFVSSHLFFEAPCAVCILECLQAGFVDVDACRVLDQGVEVAEDVVAVHRDHVLQLIGDLVLGELCQDCAGVPVKQQGLDVLDGAFSDVVQREGRLEVVFCMQRLDRGHIILGLFLCFSCVAVRRERLSPVVV